MTSALIVESTAGAWNAFLAEAQSRPVRTMRLFAEQCVIIPDGPYKGQQFSVEVLPWVGLLFDQIDNHVWAEIVATAPAQGGKTLILFVIPLLWAAVELRENTVVGLPDEEMWGDKWAIDIRPVLASSPELEPLLPTKGAASAGGKPKEAVTLTNGVELKPMTPSGGEHTRSGFTARMVSMTELYRFTGNPFNELKARQGAYNRFDAKGQLTDERRLFGEGTLTSKREMPWTLRSTDDPEAGAISTESEIQSPCPKCKKYIQWEREHLVNWRDAATEMEAAKKARWQCPACSHLFGESARRASAAKCRLVHKGQTVDKRGRVRGPVPEVSRLFFRVNAFQNLLVNTSELGAEEWEGSRLDPETPAGIDKQEYLATKKFALPFEPPLLDFRPLRPTWLRDNRCGRLPFNVLPDDTVLYTVGIDLGKFTCWYLGLAFRATGEINIVTYAAVDTSLTKSTERQSAAEKLAVKATLNRIFDELDKGLPQGSDMWMPDGRFVDSGWYPDVAFDVCKERGEGVAVLGRGKSQFDKRDYTKPTRTGAEVREIGDGWHLSYVRSRGSYQLTLDADKSKLDVQSGLRVDAGSPGSIQLPSSIDRHMLMKLCGHLAAEVQRQRYDDRGRLVMEWVTTRGRHDLLDCAGYAWAGGRYLGFSLDNPGDFERPTTKSNSGSRGGKWFA